MTTLEKAATGLEAIGSPVRLEVYRLLVRAGPNGLPVGRIQERMGIPGSTLSHHLKYLETAEMIVRRREGTTHYCTANYLVMQDLIDFLTEECCVESGPGC
ncbi:MAG: metalloregulator ArsR/SmtB family transcription factor [Pseudomonadota bacterium]